MEEVTAFLNKKYRPQGCCCFSLETATNIIGISDICATVFKLIFPNAMPTVSRGENWALIIFCGVSDAMLAVEIIFEIIFLITAAAMVLGNFKGNKKLMLPFVYLKFISLMAIMFMDVVALPSALFALGRFAEGLTIIVKAIISIVCGTYLWQIMQCRILQLDETARPEKLFSHGDPEIPAHGYVLDTSVQSAGITSSTDVGSQIPQ